MNDIYFGNDDAGCALAVYSRTRLDADEMQRVPTSLNNSVISQIGSLLITAVCEL